MPFLKGQMPIRRTLYYLDQAKIFLREEVRVLCLGCCNKQPGHEGAKDFVYWHWGQLQYKNPTVQLITYKDFTPTPFCQVFLDDGREVLMDLDGQTRQEIHDRIQRIFGKTELVLKREKLQFTSVHNPANFGKDSERHCMCEVSGQYPCPGLLSAPNFLKGNWRRGQIN